MVDIKKINAIVENRLFKASNNIKKKLPISIYDETGSYISFGNDKFYLIIFINKEEKENLDSRLNKGYDPFSWANCS